MSFHKGYTSHCPGNLLYQAAILFGYHGNQVTCKRVAKARENDLVHSLLPKRFTKWEQVGLTEIPSKWLCIYVLLQFDRFRRKLVEHTFRGDVQRTVDHELDDDELLDHVRNLAQEKLTLVEEIQQYANSESEVSSVFTEEPRLF